MPEVLKTFPSKASDLHHQKMVRRVLTHQARTIVTVGDEHSMQGRFDQHIKQVISETLESQGMDIVFGDFNCTTEDYGKVTRPRTWPTFGIMELVRVTASNEYEAVDVDVSDFQSSQPTSSQPALFPQLTSCIELE